MPLADQRGGAEQLLRTLMVHGGKNEEGITWAVAFFQDGPLRVEFQELGIQTYVVQTGRLRQVGQYVAAVRELMEVIEIFGADVVFSWMSKAHLYGAIAAWRAGLPALWYQHGIPRPKNPMDRLTTFLPAQQVAACSRMVADAQGAMFPKRPTAVVYPCVELQRFDPSGLPDALESRRTLGLPTQGPLVGIIGRLQRWKGIHVFVEAMAKIRDVHPDVHGVIVGGPHRLEMEYAGEVNRLIEARGLGDHVTVTGHQENVPEWMQAMDVVVHASDCEPFGMVIVEAMALGKPVVAGAAGGPQEIVTDGENGLLAAYEDAEQMAQQVMRYLHDGALRHRVGRAARRRALRFSPARYVKDVVHTLRSAQGELDPK